MRHASAAAYTAAAVLLTACGGGGGGSSAALPIGPSTTPVSTPTSAPSTAAVQFSLDLTLSSQLKRMRRAPAFVSPSTKSAVISVAGQSVVANCSSNACSAQLVVSVGPQTFTIKLYDGAGGAGTLLGVGKATVTIAAGTTNTIKAAYDGVVDHVSLVSSAASIPAGTTASLTLSVNAYDPDGNLIIGPHPFVDANGQPLILTLSVVNASAGGRGSMTLSQSTVSAPTEVSLAYNGLAMYQSTVSIQSSSQLNGTLGTATVLVTPTIKEFDVSPYLPESITAGPDGNVWLTDAGDAILKVTPSGSMTSFPLGGTTLNPHSPGSITLGPDENLWFSEANSGLAKITPAGQVTTYSPFAAIGYGSVNSIVTGPGDLLWAGIGSGTIAEISSDASTATGFTMSTYAYPESLTKGPSGSLLFTEVTANNIGFVSSAGVITEFATADGAPSWGITLGPDGNIWYSQPSNIIKATTSGSILARYAISAKGGAIINGPDGNLWFLEPYGNTIGRVTPQGTVTEFPVPTSYASQPQPAVVGITVGPDGNIWFGEQVNHKVGVLIY